MRADLLLRLADALEADAANEHGVKFDLGIWGHSPERYNPNPAKNVLNCGTTACAMGFAVAANLFVEEGMLPFNLKTYASFEPKFIPPGGSKDDMLEGLSAASVLFDISFREAEWFFLEWNYPREDRREARGERAVAARIRDFVAGTAAPPDEPENYD